ncbi:MAG: hypothetical protein LBE31_05920 [Deltaproteobacteria bacterium]|jgi:hypothetical protein|nr:hypothetical protein [Deltaproteobacteria bacterium]
MSTSSSKFNVFLVLASVLAFCLILIGQPSVGLAADGKLSPAPTREFFESLGEVVEFVPLKGEEGYSPDHAYGAVIRFAEEFEKTDEFRDWTLHTKRDDSKKGDTVCHKFERCTLWVPEYVDPFPLN